MSLRLRQVRQAAAKLRKDVRYISDAIGKRRLNDILNEADIVHKENQKHQNLLTIKNTANPSWHYEAFTYQYRDEVLTKHKRKLRSSLYNLMDVFKAIRFAHAQTTNKTANDLLLGMFDKNVITSIAIAMKMDFKFIDMIVKNYSNTFFPIVKQVYEEREKWITGLTAKKLKLRVEEFDSKIEGQTGVYLEMFSANDPLYHNRMDFGVFNEKHVPELNEIYGWIKKRESAGVWRPLAIKGWRWRNNRTGQLSKKPAKDMMGAGKKAGLAAFIIWYRMVKRFHKTGRLAPFGSFAKYSKRDTIYSESIFTDIFNKYVDVLYSKSVNENQYEKDHPLENEINKNLRFRIERMINMTNETSGKERYNAYLSLKGYINWHSVEKEFKANYKDLKHSKDFIKLCKKLGISI